MLHLISLMFGGIIALFRETGRAIFSTVARCEQWGRRGITSFPTGTIDSVVLLMSAFVKRGGKGLPPILLSLSIILLFLLLR